MNVLTAIKNFLTYNESQNVENFELVEDINEIESSKKQNKSTYSENNCQNKEIKTNSGDQASCYKWNDSETTQTESQNQSAKDTVTTNLKLNIEKIQKEFNLPKNQDVAIKEFKISRKVNAFIVYVDGMTDKNIINNLILKSLMTPEHFFGFKGGSLIDYIADSVLPVNQVTQEQQYEKIIEQVLNGVTALFIEGCDKCLLIESRGFEKRSVEQPVTEQVIRGSQEGFTENLRTNITLIRKIIKNRRLTTEIMTIDKTNKTDCGILYLEGIANPAIIEEVKRRLKNINIDFISGGGMLESLITDNALIPLPQIMTTERPDKTAASLMDGKVIIITDGTPFASIIPMSFFEALQTPEDYFLKWQFASFLRYLRLFALITTLLLPGLYLSLILYHKEMIPSELLHSFITARENIPFPTIVEVLLLEVSFELIREGALRVPGTIGNTLGIVGALILGQAAVQAQLVSPIIIIIVAITGISSFAIPDYSVDFSVRLLRFVFILFGAVAGFYGISVALVIVLSIACGMKSFGVPYFTPFAPKTRSNSDVITRLPIYKQNIRPDYINPLNKYKTGKVTEKWIKEKDDDKK